jgi:hypothetical protein
MNSLPMVDLLTVEKETVKQGQTIIVSVKLVNMLQTIVAEFPDNPV